MPPKRTRVAAANKRRKVNSKASPTDSQPTQDVEEAQLPLPYDGVSTPSSSCHQIFGQLPVQSEISRNQQSLEPIPAMIEISKDEQSPERVPSIIYNPRGDKNLARVPTPIEAPNIGPPIEHMTLSNIIARTIQAGLSEAAIPFALRQRFAELADQPQGYVDAEIWWCFQGRKGIDEETRKDDSTWLANLRSRTVPVQFDIVRGYMLPVSSLTELDLPVL